MDDQPAAKTPGSDDESVLKRGTVKDMVGRQMTTSLAVLGRLWRKVARAYYFTCAREDARSWHLIIPAGAWVCQRCPHVTFDFARFREHYVWAHA
jgi:hypothetical protein